jgi:hypothetical protein
MLYTTNPTSNDWEFKGLVSEKAKNEIESGSITPSLNSEYEQNRILLSMTKSLPADANVAFKKRFLFIPLQEATAVTYQATFKDKEGQDKV